MRYNNSVDALRQLLEFSEEETNRKYASEENIVSSSSSASCSITQAYEDIFYSANGAAYYFVEVTCSDGIQYGIQAYGEEARALYKEVNRYTSSNITHKVEEKKKFNDGEIHLGSLDSNGTSLIFEKVRDVCIWKKRLD
jgi:hypothetical protein